jgi:hypothetical protein
VAQNFACAPFAAADRRFGGWVESEQRVRVLPRGNPVLKARLARQDTRRNARAELTYPTPVLRKNLRGDRFQLVVMMQAAETRAADDTMRGR